MDEVNYTYDGKFEGNVFIVGRTGCGKTTIVQNLGKNNLFGNTWGLLVIKNWIFQIKRRKYQRLF